MIIHNPILTGSFTVNGADLSTITGSVATSASFDSRTTYLESTSSALTAASASLNTKVSTIESKYASTGSNTFRAPQYVTDTTVPTGFANTSGSIYTDGGLLVNKDSYFSSSMFIKGNLTIYGTQSIAYITSSQLNIATNLITVNTATPSVRFGGLAVYDSGSTNLTGSILWDSQNNRWVYSNPSGSSYDGGMLISGPRNTSGVGSEQGTTACMVMVGQGGDHITSSLIYHDSVTTCIPGTLLGGIACFGTVVCAPSMVSANTGTTTTFIQVCTGVANARLNAGTSADVLVGRCDTTNYTNVIYADSTQWPTCFRWSVGMRPGGSNYTVYNEVYSAAAIFICNNNNYVGINCTSPSYQLDVNGTGRYTGQLLSSLTTSGTPLRIDTVTGTGVSSCTKFAIGTGGQYGTASAKKYLDIDFNGYNNYTQARIRSWDENGTTGYGSLYFYTNSTAGTDATNLTMALNYNGNVGIGVATPTYPLTRNGMTIKASGTDGAELMMLSNTDTGFTGGGLVRNNTDLGLINRTAGCLIFATNATERMWLTSNGNLLLGSNFSCKGLLKVAGNVEICKTLYYNGGDGVGGAMINAGAVSACSTPSYNLRSMFGFNNDDNYGAFMFIHTAYIINSGKQGTVTGVVTNGSTQVISILANTLEAGVSAPGVYSTARYCVTFCWGTSTNSNTQFIALAG